MDKVRFELVVPATSDMEEGIDGYLVDPEEVAEVTTGPDFYDGDSQESTCLLTLKHVVDESGKNVVRRVIGNIDYVQKLLSGKFVGNAA